MLCGFLPFEGTTDAEISESILNLRYDFDDETWTTISDDVKDLISSMLVYEENRITPKEALNHKWVKKMLEKSDEVDYNSKYLDKLETFQESSQLKKAILSFLATKVSDEEIKDEIELFNSFDQNNDGYITK